MALFERSELEKYLTAEELTVLDDGQPQPAQLPSASTAADGPEERA
jgi:hypothetical protein